MMYRPTTLTDMAPSDTPQLILCDLGNTLVDESDPDWTARLAAVAQMPGGAAIIDAALHLIGSLREEAEAARHVQRPALDMIEAYLTANSSRPPLDEFMEGAWQLLGGEDTAYLSPLPGARELLDAAAVRGVPVVAVSNTALPGDLVNRVLERHGVADHFRATVYSSDAGWKKPAPEIFECALSVQPAAGTSVVMIGNDWGADIKPALERGWRAFWLQDKDRCDSDWGDEGHGAITDTGLRRISSLNEAIGLMWGTQRA